MPSLSNSAKTLIRKHLEEPERTYKKRPCKSIKAQKPIQISLQVLVSSAGHDAMNFETFMIIISCKQYQVFLTHIAHLLAFDVKKSLKSCSVLFSGILSKKSCRIFVSWSKSPVTLLIAACKNATDISAVGMLSPSRPLLHCLMYVKSLLPQTAQCRIMMLHFREIDHPWSR